MKKPTNKRRASRRARQSSAAQSDFQAELARHFENKPGWSKRPLYLLVFVMLAALVCYPLAQLGFDVAAGAVTICSKGCATYHREGTQAWAFWGAVAIKGFGYLIIIAIAALGAARTR
ncbi:MAG: hypothetical protein E6Q71_01585 [Pseudomonas sp.]|nr:MAG: hypothetical protein E6Q71_01585 [Pseudomonas sp.]